MPPKPSVKKTTAKVSATSKAVDDFLAQSTVPAGMLERQENERKQKARLEELKEKYLTLDATTNVQLNDDALNRCRVLSSIFSGTTAGIFGFGALAGLMWWIAMNLTVGLMVYLRIVSLGTEADGESKYFKNPLQKALSGVMDNLMTFLLFWIMFFNIVYVV